MIKCPKCDYENKDDALYCGLCYNVFNKETKPEFKREDNSIHQVKSKKVSSLSIKIGLILATVHLSVFFLILFSGQPLGGIVFLVLDAPLVPLAFLFLGPIGGFIIFGVLGTLMWFCIPILIDKIYKILFSRIKGGSKIILVSTMMLGLYFCFIGGFRVFFNKLGGSLPKEVRAPVTKKGQDLISETTFFENKNLGNQLRDIVQGDLYPSPGLEIGIAGIDGAMLVDSQANIKLSVAFGADVNNANIIDVNNDGICEYLVSRSFGHKDGGFVGLINHQGNYLWKDSEIDEAYAGDFNSDGKLEILGINQAYGREGFVLLDGFGQKIWEKSVDFNRVTITNLIKTENLRIVAIKNTVKGLKLEADYITILDKDGNIIKEGKPPFSFDPFSFSICQWPSKNGASYILCNEDGVIRLIDFNLQSLIRFVAPGCKGQGFIKGVPVKFKKDEDEYFAVIKEVSGVDKNGFGRNVLYIFNSHSELVYQRVFEQQYTDKAIAAVILGDSGTESLFVAGEGKVWQYKFKQ